MKRSTGRARRQPARRTRRKAPIPRNAARRALSPQPPRAVEHYLALAYRRFAAAFAAAVKKVVRTRVAAFAKPEPEQRTDAEEDDDVDEAELDRLMTAAERAASSSVDESSVRLVTKTAADRVHAHSKAEFKRLGIDLVKAEPNFGPKIERWRKENVDRIRGMQDDQLGKIRKVLADGRHHRVETLQKEIERQLDDVSASRAELIARDQVLTLNAQITADRQQAAGIEAYVWSTSQDERVRPEHEALEGKTFTWESGGDPEEGHPGEAVMCRCIAFPILPELGDETDE